MITHRSIVIYCRYSSELQSTKSCVDQEREVREALTRMGIDTANATVIHDEAESGTKVFRDEFARIETMMRGRQIAILAVDDQSRFSRADNAFGIITDLVYSGGRFISTGEGIDTEQTGWELRVKVMELHNSTTIRELGRRVRRGQMGRVLHGLSAGDLCYGYESFLLHPDKADEKRGPKPERGIRINENEAQWVRQMFDWVAMSRSIAWIAEELTRRGAPCNSRRKSVRWHPRHVRKILGNSKYIGHWIWGASRSIRNSVGRRKQLPVPVEQQVVTERPELRIIDDTTWSQAQARLARLKDVYGQKPDQRPRGPKVHHTVLYPQGLLAGLVQCGQCGARLWQLRSGPRTYLGCPNAGKGTGCNMNTRVPLAKAEPAVLECLADLLNSWPDWLEKAMAAMRQRLEDVARSVPGEVANDRRRLTSLEKQIENLVDALARGSSQSQALTDRLAANEQEIRQLRERVERAERLLAAPVAMPDQSWLAAQFRDMAGLIRDGDYQASLLLRKLVGCIKAHAVIPPGKTRGYAQLRFHVDGWETLRCGLQQGEKLDRLEALFALPVNDSASGELVIDLGGPTQMDKLAPQIAQWRAEGVKWREIVERTGLDFNRAYRAWKRYVDANKTLSVRSATSPPKEGEQNADVVGNSSNNVAAESDSRHTSSEDDDASDDAIDAA